MLFPLLRYKVSRLFVGFFFVALFLCACSESDQGAGEIDADMTIAEMLAKQQSEEQKSESVSLGRFDIHETYLARIHSFTAPEEGWLVNSHIVETDNMLVLLDAQISLPYVEQLRDYIDSLEKPLDRIYISHDHMEHWFGVELFPDVPVYVQPPILESIQEDSHRSIELRQEEYGLQVSETDIAFHPLLVHSDIIDGLTYEFELVENGESDWRTVIWLPEINVALVQDMISHNAHSFFTEADLQTWIRNLAVFSVDARDHDIFVGHGYPAKVDTTQIGEQIKYLQTAGQVLKSLGHTGEADVARAMKAAYPDYGASILLDASAQYHFLR